MAGIDRRIVDLIDKRIAAPEAAPVFCIGIDKVGNRRLQVKKPVAVGQLYLHEPEAGLTEGEVGIKRQDCIEIARRMVVARTLFPDLRKSLAYRLTEGKPYVNVSASFGEGSEKPYAAVQFLPEIKDDKGVFILPAVVKHSNVRLAESYLEFFPTSSFSAPVTFPDVMTMRAGSTNLCTLLSSPITFRFSVAVICVVPFTLLQCKSANLRIIPTGIRNNGIIP